jgi:hypothetical protein
VRRWSVNLAFLPINGVDGNTPNRASMNGFEAAAFAKSVSQEMTISFFNKVMETNSLQNIRGLHKRIGAEIIKNIAAASAVKK